MRKFSCSILTGFGLLMSLSAFSSEAPSVAQIKSWAPPEQAAMGISVDLLVPVTLRGGEQAYLASVSYKESMRNGWAGYLLVRPLLKQARSLDEFGGQYNGITPLNSYEPSQSAVIIGTSASGQGTSESSYSLVAFDGWDVKSLYSASESDNSGSCGMYSERYCKGNNVFINALTIPAPVGKLAIAVTNVSYSSPDLETTEAKISNDIKIVFVEDPRR